MGCIRPSLLHIEQEIRHLDGDTEIDEVSPFLQGEGSTRDNLEIVHYACHKTKQDSDLRVARALIRLRRIQKEQYAPNLSSILERFGGAKYLLWLMEENQQINYILSDIGDNRIVKCPIQIEALFKMKYFFTKLPIEYSFQDDRVNPIHTHVVHKFVQEFIKKPSRLFVSTEWVKLEQESGRTKVNMFDAGHRVTAQVLLGARQLPMRVFLNPNRDLLSEVEHTHHRMDPQMASSINLQRNEGQHCDSKSGRSSARSLRYAEHRLCRSI